MRPFAGGINLEERLRTKLEAWCAIQYDPTFDHEYKLDFIVTSFKGVPKFPPPIGLQVTVRDDDVAKQVEFLTIQQKHRVTPRSVYLEVDSDANVDGVALVVYAALISLVFDKLHEKDEILGLRVRKSFAFEFFDLKENIDRLRKAEPALPETREGEIVWGEITNYGAISGFGFISSGVRSKPFFFHITSVIDRNLAETLREAVKGFPNQVRDDLRISVEFEDGGYTKDGAKNPEALRVRRRARPSQ